MELTIEQLNSVVKKLTEKDEKMYLSLLTEYEKSLLRRIRAFYGEDAIVIPKGNK